MTRIITNLAAIALLACTALAQAPSDSIRQFTPALKTKPQFNVYGSPVKVQVSASSPSSLLVSAGSGSTTKDPAVAARTNVAIAYLNTQHGIPTENIKITDAYIDDATGIAHIYLCQVVGGVRVANGLANVNVDRSGHVISSSQSFAPLADLPSSAKARRSNSPSSAVGSLVARADAEVSLKSALKSLTDYVRTSVTDADLAKVVVAASSSLASGEPGFVLSGLPSQVASKGSSTAQQALIQTSDGALVPVWHMVLQQDTHWWSAHVNSETGAIEAINDWVSHAEAYRVYPKNVNSPSDGARSLVVDPANKDASPKGWVTEGSTYGNNVWAQNNPSGGDTWKTNYRPMGNSGTFDFALDLSKQPKTYIDAATTQLFYTVNVMHDVTFAYGFTEAAGNFQDVNYSGQGAGGDYVVAFAQDGSGTDNANFATPPDGQNGVMRMYVWTETSPNRDGDLEQDIVAHEFTHGVSNRLTGGPSNTDCLYDGEAGGMGEGWSDTVANLLRIVPGMTRSTDMVMGKYSYGQNIRSYAYSTSLTTNPQTYKLLNSPAYKEVHSIGEVWATILYEVIWNLIDACGGGVGDIFAKDLSKGNCLAMQIILDAMKLQPCNPDFIQARDAIVQAENNLSGGKYKCDIWRAFSKRGMGPGASAAGGSKHVEDYAVPDGC
ncbi:hypothetical protein GGI15_001398 [Coemansia interrupta]|uniref:Extracellular metalloproteinase n=1 Tax=Coemansia interrupta TaxID=1126814 RepID=A0A9W8LNX4_9FUNG|nr:hypothetical protein GGI15_001398 [Coemansia interrupta]